jgi:hypothetical protein
MEPAGMNEGMHAKVVVVADGLALRDVALDYAVTLAGRMEMALVVLFLLRLEVVSAEADDGTRNLERSVEQALTPHLRAARTAGIPVEPIIRVGSPYSELMKYLAENRSVHTMVWGGEPSLLERRANPRKPHWLTRIRDRIDLPVVVPSLKS